MLTNLEASPAAAVAKIERPPAETCYHCGTACRGSSFRTEDRAFCCAGCLAVYQLLAESSLSDFYDLDPQAGVRVPNQLAGKYSYLDKSGVRERIVDFAGERFSRVTLRLPAIHCVACVWLLENLCRIQAGIGRAEVNFLRKEVAITFENNACKLSEVVTLLAQLGYEPDLRLSDLDNDGEAQRSQTTSKKLWLQLGVAAFAFGNNMLFSIALYLGLDSFHGPAFQRLVGYFSMALALPVLLFSAQDYFRLAWTGLKNKLLTLEVPIAIGIIVIFVQSAYEVLSARGEGYFDSFAGLLFFLLCGRLFQAKTFNRLAFDRDFRSFFPLSVTRLSGASAQFIALSELAPGDHLLIRHGELIPADARLRDGEALIDYSFVTGESEPVQKSEGDLLYAGGRQLGGAMEVETVKAVSQSYLTELWNQAAFKKEVTESLDTLINRYSQRFTRLILGIACSAAIAWAFKDSSRALKAFTSILIVACPCALALAAPFTLGTATRLLGRRSIFIRNPQVLEMLAQVDTVVFDKTGTLTSPSSTRFEGRTLSAEEEVWICSLARHSTHPYARRIVESLSRGQPLEMVRSFGEMPGGGLHGTVAGREIALGSAGWLSARGVRIPCGQQAIGSTVQVAIDSKWRGRFLLESALRPDVQELVSSLSRSQEVALLSGDNEMERERFTPIFDKQGSLHFNQSPLDKLNFVQGLQERGQQVMMVGDGLNDAGALKQSNVGVAIVENAGAFSPASDIIMAAQQIPQIGRLLQFSKRTVSIIYLSLAVSSLYNILGIGIAAAGLLAPIVCAVLMPLSSISVVVFACAATTWQARRTGL